MPVTTAGLQEMLKNCIGTGTPFNTANTKLAVGDGTEPFTVAQTNLTGTQKTVKAVTAGYPIATGTRIQAQASFGANEANFNWNEWGLFNGTPGTGVMLSRSIDSLGRKVQGQTWILTATIEFALV